MARAARGNTVAVVAAGRATATSGFEERSIETVGLKTMGKEVNKGSGSEHNSRVDLALERYRARLRHDLRGALDSMLLYGSRARGDAVVGSDIDVLIIMKGPFDYGDMLDRTSDATAAISLEYDVVISRVLVSREDYESKQTPFLMNVRREAVAL
jgi:predicted nucleotidyltransferase